MRPVSSWSVILVRAGQCVRDEQGRVVGRADSPLTPLGHAQAQSAADQLRHRGVQRVFSSDLTRARITGQRIADVLGVNLEVDGALTERDFGDAVGARYADRPLVVAHSVEPIDDVFARLVDFFDRAHGSGLDTVAVVSHASVIPIAVAVLRGDGPLDVDWFDLPSGGIVTVRLDESVS